MIMMVMLIKIFLCHLFNYEECPYTEDDIKIYLHFFFRVTVAMTVAVSVIMCIIVYMIMPVLMFSTEMRNGMEEHIAK